MRRVCNDYYRTSVASESSRCGLVNCSGKQTAKFRFRLRKFYLCTSHHTASCLKILQHISDPQLTAIVFMDFFFVLQICGRTCWRCRLLKLWRTFGRIRDWTSGKKVDLCPNMGKTLSVSVCKAACLPSRGTNWARFLPQYASLRLPVVGRLRWSHRGGAQLPHYHADSVQRRFERSPAVQLKHSASVAQGQEQRGNVRVFLGMTIDL